MTNQVKVTLAGNSKEVQRALDQMNSKVDKADAKMQRMRQGGKQAAQQTSSGFQKAGQAIGRSMRDVLTTFSGVTSVTQVLTASLESFRAEMEKIRSNREQTRSETVTFQQTLRDTLGAFVADPTLTEETLTKRILEASERTNALPKTIAKALQTAASARGSLSGETGAKAVETAAMLNPINEGQMGTLTGRFLDIAKMSGSQDMEAIAGFFLNAGSAARLTSFDKIGNNLMPAIQGLTKLGATPEEAAELTAAMTQILQDETGRLSSTAILTAFNQLKTFTPQRATKGENKGKLIASDRRFGEFVIPEEQFQRFSEASDPKSQLKVLNESPELFKAFSIIGSFQAKTEQGVLSLLRGDESALDELKKAEATVNPIDARQRKMFRDEVESQRKATPIARSQERQDAALNRARIEDIEGGRLGSGRRILEELMENQDLPGPDTFGPGAFDLGRAAQLRRSLLRRESRLGTGVVQSPEDAAILTLKELIGSEGKLGDRFRRFPKGSKAESEVKEAIETLEEQKATFAERDNQPANAQIINKTVSSVTGAVKGFGDIPELQQLLRQIADNTSELKKPNPPRTTERPTSRVSRGE